MPLAAAAGSGGLVASETYARQGARVAYVTRAPPRKSAANEGGRAGRSAHPHGKGVARILQKWLMEVLSTVVGHSAQ
jgi:hypothetical protein